MRFVAQQLLPVLSSCPSDPLPMVDFSIVGRQAGHAASRQPEEAEEPPSMSQAASSSIASDLLPLPTSSSNEEGMQLARLPVSHLDMDEWEVQPAPDGFYRVGCLTVQLAPKLK